MTISRARVALAEYDVLMRGGPARALERSGLEVVGQCGDAPHLIALVREHRPELVIVEIRSHRVTRPRASMHHA